MTLRSLFPKIRRRRSPIIHQPRPPAVQQECCVFRHHAYYDCHRFLTNTTRRTKRTKRSTTKKRRAILDFDDSNFPTEAENYDAPTPVFPEETAVLICSNLPLQPTASAAGVRTSMLLTKLAACRNITSVNYASSAAAAAAPVAAKRLTGDGEQQAARDEKNWNKLGIKFHALPPNRSQQAKELLTKLSNESEDLLVIFDRFYNEEMFSHSVHEHCPTAVLALDLQDLHSLRSARQAYIEKHWIDDDTKDDDGLINLPLSVVPEEDDPKLCRELASIYRCDVTLVCSRAEIRLLNTKYGIPKRKLVYAPMFGDLLPLKKLPRYEERRDYVFVGGFCHAPNVDAVRQLKRLWPKLREATMSSDEYKPPHQDGEGVKLHIYGAYCPEQLRKELHDPETGFLMHGYYPSSVEDVLSTKRVMLSPLRFGAGIKGKHIEAWKAGCPVVTTVIGAEGMWGEKKSKYFWGGRLARSDIEFIGGADNLYNNKDNKWDKTLHNPKRVLRYFCGRRQWENACDGIIDAIDKCHDNRKSDYVRSVLWHESNRSTEYLSKYIEIKETTTTTMNQKRNDSLGDDEALLEKPLDQPVVL